MAANANEFPVEVYAELLSRFPEAYQEKLRRYTGQELYVIYRVCTFQATPNKDGDISAKDVATLTLKNKLYNWLRGTKVMGLEVKPMVGAYITLAGKRFSGQVSSFIDECEVLDA